MSGLVKAKEYKLEDSNVEALGGDEHKGAVKGVAEKAPEWRRHAEYSSGKVLTGSEAVKDAKGLPHHLEIWRIEKFKVKFWPREQHGSFYSGDSYIVLHTFKEDKDGPIKMDLHFWLGKDTTRDEMGTAAYKTVELDTLLDDLPVQHREVQEHESEEFTRLFSNILKCGGIRYLEGGIDSGFRHVEPESYKPRLMHLKGKKKVRVTQMPMEWASLNSGDVFILDLGLEVIVWTGAKAGMFEKNKAREVSDSIKTERKGKIAVLNIREGDNASDAPDEWKKFFDALGGAEGKAVKTAEEGGKDDEEQENGPALCLLFRLSDASGTLTFKKEAEGKDNVNSSLLDTNDVFVYDCGFKIFVWVGKGSNKNERDNAITNTTKYMEDNKRPNHIPITRVLEGGDNREFLSMFPTK